MTIIYEAPLRCDHRDGRDLPNPANCSKGTIARCACGRPFRRLSDGGYPFWQFISERKVARILKRAAKEQGQA